MFGLIGEKLKHSFSPKIHGYFGDYDYALFELKKEELEGFIKRDDIEGFNVTIPYKKEIIKYLDYVDKTAEKIGAVNTVVKKDGKTYGYNTDYFGLDFALKSAGIDLKNKKVLLLGSGGASAAAKCLLNDYNADYKIVSRTGEVNYQNVYDFKDTEVIINATPVGMYPDTGKSLLDLDKFDNLTGVCDLIYNPLLTKLLFDAKVKNIKCVNGLTMLVAQAKKSHDLFLDKDSDDNIIGSCVKRLEAEVRNVVLIGMSGSGKTTVGKELSKLLNKPFYDTDREIVKRTGKTVSEIFRLSGEAGFRQIESEVIKDLSRLSGVIIATGGGAVTKDENYYPLKQNGVVVRILRSDDDLDVTGRPLVKSKEDAIVLAAKREPMYKAFSDYTVVNDKMPIDCAKKIGELL